MIITIYVITIIVAIISYLIGSISSSIIISKLISGKDIRESGSGNAGATNMLRTHGKKMGIITLLCDILKGVIAVLIAVWINSSAKTFNGSEPYILWGMTLDAEAKLALSRMPYIAGMCAMLGHNFPIYFHFKGGKGVATGLGVVMTLDWKSGLFLLVLALVIMAISKYVSLGSIAAGVMLIISEPIKMIVTGSFDTVIFLCYFAMGALIVVRHRDNIKRLLNGTERKLGKKIE